MFDNVDNIFNVFFPVLRNKNTGCIQMQDLTLLHYFKLSVLHCTLHCTVYRLPMSPDISSEIVKI